ncbi:MAG: M48 family metalloprotease [Acidobacteriota bacterium]
MRATYFAFLLSATLSVQQAGAARHPDIDRIGARNINHGIYGFPNFISPEEEARLGAKLDEALQLTEHLVVERVAQARIESIAARVALSSDYTGEVRVRLTTSRPLKATAIMGGYLYIDTSVVALTSSDDELAAVLAHEVAHLAARHGSELICYYQFLERRFKTPRVIANNITDRILANELEADELAAQYLQLAGYDPTALPLILCKLDGGPTTRRRIEELRNNPAQAAGSISR